MASYIIKTTNGKYFAGWGVLGEMKFALDRKLAYRMQRPIAQKTFDKMPEAKEIEKM